MATTKITSPELFDLGSLNTALQLPSGTTAQRPASPSTGEWRYNTDNNLIEFYDGAAWRDLQDEDIPPIPSEHFNTVTYTGTGGTQAITGVGFQPDWVWIKNRNDTNSHILQDTSRGAGKTLFSNLTSAEDGTSGDLIASFDSDGFTVNENFNGSTTNESTNKSGNTYVAWCWKLNGGTTSSNTDGSITSTVQANTKAGFSLIKYTGNGSASATVGHGLGSIPELTIFKQLDSGGTSGGFWNTYLTSTNTVGFLNSSAAFVANTGGTNGSVDIAGMSSTTFGFLNGSSTVNNQNNSGSDYIVYALTSVAGYSKIGTYTGNGSSNGPIINTGFEPAFLIIKRTDTDPTSGGNTTWLLYDNKRNPSNPRNTRLWADNSAGEATLSPQYDIDFLSNGFQLKDGTALYAMNTSGGNYLYIAFASDPSAAPVLANSFTTNLYTGNGGTKILGTGFNPSLAWLKIRSSSASHSLTNLVRGNNLVLQANEVSAEASGTISLTSTGIDIGSSNALRNGLLNQYVAWSWQGNSLPSINNDGSIQSLVSANQAAGFSVVGWTGTGSAGTLGHGLTSAPELIIVKDGTNAYNWYAYSTATGSNIGWEGLNTTNASFAASSQMTTTDTLITDVPSIASLNTSGANMVIFAFHSVSGFSKIGSYTGNGSSNSITGLGFQPDFVMIRSTASNSWFLYDSERTVSVGTNPGTANARPYLLANANGAENGAVSANIDLDSDGFSMNTTESGLNTNTQTYVYMAFKNNREFAAAGTMAFTVVAGGGGGGVSTGSQTDFQRTGCGGGAGGFRGSGDVTGGQCTPQDNITLASGTYTVTVGAGGSPGSSGQSSSIAGPSMTTISTVGGGRGASTAYQSDNGGSGGGRSYYNSANGNSTACEGFGRTLEGLTVWQGGGGGADGIQDGLYATYKSGKGVSSIMSGTYEFYAGGGATGSANTTRPLAAPGGGGNGQISGETAANTPAEITGTANTGGGGGGGSQNTTTGAKGGGGSGGSGIVILRLKTSEYSGTVTGSPTVTTDGDETIIKFTASGTYVHS